MSHTEPPLTTREIAGTQPAEPEPATPAPPEAPAETPLLPDDQGAELRGRWEGIQGTFVDSPRQSVENADALVAQVMQLIAEGFAREREALEEQWGRGDDVSTEDLRIALQRYRSFFHRLLSA